MLAQDTTLDRRTAVVTGASGALGAVIAADLGALGAAVYGLDVAPPSAAVPWVSIECDVGAAVEVERAIGVVLAERGGVDVLVNAAGVYDTIRFTHLVDPARWARDVRVNLSSAFYTTRLVVEGMAQRGWGRIVNVSSMSSHGGYKQSSYAATKAGLLGLTTSLALEYADRGVTANAVLPGIIATARTESAPPDIVEQSLGQIPAGRFGTPAEVSSVVAFLCSPAAGYINGIDWAIDGGTSLLQFRFARRSDPAATLPRAGGSS